VAITLARPTVLQRSQIGVETTYGTPVIASARMPAISIKPKPMAESMRYNTQGQSFDSVVIPNREWAQAAIEGPMTYSELPYLLSSLFQSVSPTPGAHSDYVWTVAPSLDSQDVPAVYTIEHGDDSGNGIRMAGSVVTDLTLDMSRQECKLTGTMLGLAWTTAFTLNGDAPRVENIPITAGSVAWYLDAVYGSIGTTKLTKPLKAQIAVTGRWQPEWVMDRNTGGTYTQLVMAKPTTTVQLTLEANSQGMSLFSQYRAGSLAYLQAVALGPAIGGGDTYQFVMSIPVEILEPLELSDEGGVYAIGWSMAMIGDDTAGYPIQFAIQNKLASL
jgi:hypothetical protein